MVEFGIFVFPVLAAPADSLDLEGRSCAYDFFGVLVIRNPVAARMELEAGLLSFVFRVPGLPGPKGPHPPPLTHRKNRIFLGGGSEVQVKGRQAHVRKGARW